jgi:hypothetical protein
MNEKAGISEAVEILETYGELAVERIQRQNDEKRPDLAARFGNELYLIEHKIKGDNPDERRAEAAELENSKVITRAKPLQPRSTLSGILEGALSQIEAHPDASTAFKVIWIRTWGVWAEANEDSLLKGLYGSQHVFDPDAEDRKMKDCLYLYFADFQRFREIDAVIVSDGEGLRILVNEFSPRYPALMQGHLVSRFSRGVYDPRALAVSGEVYSLWDHNGDRRNRIAVLEELAARLGVETMMVMPMNEFHVVSNIPLKPASGDPPNTG